MAELVAQLRRSQHGLEESAAPSEAEPTPLPSPPSPPPVLAQPPLPRGPNAPPVQPLSPLDDPDHMHRQHTWNGRSDDDHDQMHILRKTQELWMECHPAPNLLLKKAFPTTRREALRVPYSAMSRCEKVTSPEYRAAIERVLGRFPEAVRRTISHLFLNYLTPYQKMIQQQGRNLFVIKAYHGRQESHCWFIPLDEVAALHSASSEMLRQGISYNDLALVQTYSVLSVLAVHAETWDARPGQGAQSYGECTWIGGMAFHYAMGEDVRQASLDFAMVPTERMPEIAAKNAKARETRAKQKAKKAEQKLEEQTLKKAEEVSAREAEDKTRRAGLIKVHESLAEALARGSLLNDPLI